MKRFALFLIIGSCFAHPLQAEDAAPTAADTDLPAAVTETVPASPAEEAPAPEPAAAPAVESAVPVVEAANNENLEFVSGEIASVDEASSSLTVKLYGEADNAAGDKTLKVTVDANTDITDGEQDRDLKSLSAGTEVDVEYDAATNKATYIFVY